MEQNQPPSLFEMELDSYGQTNLLSISKWSKFISVTTIVCLILILLSLLASGRETLEKISGTDTFAGGAFTDFIVAIVLVVIALVSAWTYFLLRSSTLIRKGLVRKNSADLAEGFKALRISFVFSAVISGLGIISTLFTMLK